MGQEGILWEDLKFAFPNFNPVLAKAYYIVTSVSLIYVGIYQENGLRIKFALLVRS